MAQIAGQRLNMGGASAYIDHADVIGSTTMETDPAGGVQWKIAYYPWGQILGQGGTRQSVVFAGLDWQVNDPSYPSATREYNDGLGRWLTPDPDNAGADVGDSQSWDMYSYVGNNPITRTDPSGLDCLYFSSHSTTSLAVGVEGGYCSQPGGTYVNGTVDVSSLTYDGSELGYSFTPYSGGSGTGVIGFGAPASSSDLPPLALAALPLAGNWASTGIKNAAVNMALNGALTGVGELIGLGAEALLASREGAAGEGLIASGSRAAVSDVLDSGAISSAQRAAVKRALQRAAAGDTVTVTRLAGGSLKVETRVLGRSGGFATYEKVIDTSGTTVSVVQKAYDAAGSLVHVDPKYP